MARHELLQAMAQLDGHFATDDASPANAGSWVTVRWYLIRMLDGLGLARLELESNVRSPEEQVRMALQHVRSGLGEAKRSARGGTEDRAMAKGRTGRRSPARSNRPS
jgi:hypothetical protein